MDSRGEGTFPVVFVKVSRFAAASRHSDISLGASIKALQIELLDFLLLSSLLERCS